MSSKIPILAVSLGDPAGIGPEVVAKTLKDKAYLKKARFLLVGHPDCVPSWLSPERGRHPWLMIEGKKWKDGRPSAASGAIAAKSVRQAFAAVKAGLADALVTAPLSKDAMFMAGEKFPGHTELLADLAGLKPDQVGMLLAGGNLRVFLVTRHCSLKKALADLNKGMLAKAIRLAEKGLRESMGIAKPRLALAAVNPHAGEAGAFGSEEIDTLNPVVRSFSHDKKFKISGPYPADTLFVRAVRGEFDVVICPYHDQGLIPLKLLAFDSGVNITLGLPIIRTSPDHGTAYDIVGKGLASPGSFKAAVDAALEMIIRRGRGMRDEG